METHRIGAGFNSQEAGGAVPQKSFPDPQLVPEVVVYLGTLLLAYLSGWTTKDLIWSLWLSSLVFGYLAVAAKSIRKVRQPGQTTLDVLLSTVGLIGALLAFTIHFGPFHYVYASILDLLMPLMSHPERVYIGKLTWKGGGWFSLWGTIAIAVSRYWPVVVMNAWRDRSILLSDATAETNLSPYKAILRLHFLVMGLGACYGLGLDSFPVYALVFTVLYPPVTLWRRIFQRRTASNSSA
jgi:hypothetical protein